MKLTFEMVEEVATREIVTCDTNGVDYTIQPGDPIYKFILSDETGPKKSIVIGKEKVSEGEIGYVINDTFQVLLKAYVKRDLKIMPEQKLTKDQSIEALENILTAMKS